MPALNTDPPAGVRTAARDHPRWLTALVIIACLLIHAGVVSEGQRDALEVMTKWGYVPAPAIWEGAWWGLVSSVFLHVELWHLAFNIYWLWVLGSRMERALGPWRWLAFFLAAAVVTSSLELAVEDVAGVGASGVGYAMFGFMWVSQRRYPLFKKAMRPQNVILFLVWMVGCVVLTYLYHFPVGNVAHVSGLVFGCLVAACFVYRYRPALTAGALALLGFLALIPLLWCPWSVTWWRVQAYNAHHAQDFKTAISRYDQVLRLDPEDAWAYENRGRAYQALGDTEKARKDLEKARRLDPKLPRPE